jgi:NTP pyrophosphatase (non-canonical NTP hydrolase)
MTTMQGVMSMNDKLKKIINTYGVTNQLKYFQSEVYELTEAMLWNEFDELVTRHSKEHIAEEIADVMVMLKQFQLYYCIKDEEIEDIMRFKINRQIGRIKNEIHSGTN